MKQSLMAFIGKHAGKLGTTGVGAATVGLAVLNNQMSTAQADLKKLDEKTSARVTRAEFEKLNRERILDFENRLRNLEAYKNATSDLVLDLKSDVNQLKSQRH